MFQFIKLASALRIIKTSISNKDYYAAVTTLIGLMNTLGLSDEATKAQAVVDGIKNGDYREIAVNSLSLVSEGLSMIFGLPPINVSVSGPDDALLHKLEYYSAQADKVAANIEEPVKLAAAPTDTTAIDPAVVSGILSLVTTLVQAWLNRKKSTPAVAA